LVRMMYGRGFGGGFGGGAMLGGGLLMLLLWVIIVVGAVMLVVMLVRRSSMHGMMHHMHDQGPAGGTTPGAPTHDEAVAIARKRFASGEITKEQFDEMMAKLAG